MIKQYIRIKVFPTQAQLDAVDYAGRILIDYDQLTDVHDITIPADTEFVGRQFKLIDENFKWTTTHVPSCLALVNPNFGGILGGAELKLWKASA